MPDDSTEPDAAALFDAGVLFAFSRSQTQPVHASELRLAGYDLYMFLKDSRAEAEIAVSPSVGPQFLQLHLYGSIEISKANGTITNWVDLYGDEFTIDIGTRLPKGTTLEGATLGYDDTVAPRMIHVYWTNEQRRVDRTAVPNVDANGSPLAYVWPRLGPLEIGFIPKDYPGPAPSSFREP
jgi:hypothetical protein